MDTESAREMIARNYRPAPKEEEMQCVDCGVKCADGPICNDCNSKRHERWTRTTERRAVARDAYMAALGGLGAAVDVKDPVGEAVTLALETVRRWDAFLAAVDAEGGE